MPNWWSEKEQAALDRARKSSEEILALRGQAEETKKDLREAINRRDVAETARLMPLSAAFDAILADARPVELRLGDVSDAVKCAIDELHETKEKIKTLAPPPGAFENPLARGAAMRGDEDDVDRWLADDVTRDAVKAHIRWWKRWRSVSAGLRAEFELREVLAGKRTPYDSPAILDQAEEELKTMENILSELEILLGKIKRANERYDPPVGESIITTVPGAERFKM